MEHPEINYRLPIEMWLEIFGNLKIEELVKLRLVSKEWKQMVDKVHIKHLAICVDPNAYVIDAILKQVQNRHKYTGVEWRSNWYKWHNFSNWIEPKKLSPINFSLVRLEMLKLDLDWISSELDDEFDVLSILNGLAFLKFLVITNIKIKKDVVLNLPNLEFCHIDVYPFPLGQSFTITIDSPKLELFESSKLDFFRFENPETIQHLMFSLLFPEAFDLSVFKNVNRVTVLSPFCKQSDFILKLPNLSHVHVSFSDECIRSNKFRYTSCINFMNDLFDQRRSLNKKDLKIIFSNYELEFNGLRFEDYDFSSRSTVDEDYDYEYYDERYSYADYYDADDTDDDVLISLMFYNDLF